MYNFNNAKIEQAWNKFIRGENVDSTLVRKEILDSWIRSKNFGVSWENVERKVLSKQELKKRISSRSAMVEAATTMMETIYSTVKGSGFLVVLTDEDGYILKIIGDEDIYSKAKAQENILIEGANRNENYIGTNGIGTSLAINAPIQVRANEHYYKPHKNWTCSGAPIHDLEGNIIGCLNLSGPSDKIQLHSLGMIVAGVKAIEMQLENKNAYYKINVFNNQLNTIINSTPYGTILINNRGIISHTNKLIGTMLGMKNEEIIGEPIDKIIKYDKSVINLNTIKTNVYNKELLIETSSRNIRCLISVNVLKDLNGNKDGLVLTIQENKALHKLINKMTATQAEFTFDDIIGNSDVMKKAKKLGRIASRSNANVLLLGESGTGKELFAQSIHNNGDRSGNPFIAINCGSLPRNLIESELFGYEGGAFTGAKKEGRPGKFELANGGTIFLDEIGDMPLDIQVSLLRVLENREVTRIGGTKNIRIDVKVIAATNKNLEELIENKMFREDLYYRLNVLSISVPPLRERNEDIIYLADYFLLKHSKRLSKNISGFTEEVYQIFSTYSWPGNVRELENVIERAVNICEQNIITRNELPFNLQKVLVGTDIGINDKNKNFTREPVTKPNSLLSLKDSEKQAIINALIKYKGNVKKASEELGIHRRTMYRKFSEYSIDYTKYRSC